MTRNNADMTSKAIAEQRMNAYFTTQIVFVLFTSRMVFVGNEDVETDILNCVDTMMSVFEKLLSVFKPKLCMSTMSNVFSDIIFV